MQSDVKYNFFSLQKYSQEKIVDDLAELEKALEILQVKIKMNHIISLLHKGRQTYF